MKAGIPPFEFIITNYQEIKATNGYVDSPVMQTHLQDYAFQLRLYPNGLEEGTGNHMSMQIRVKCDHFIITTIKFTITLELLNLNQDQEHCKIERVFQTESYNTYSRFISHADLERDTDEQIQYLKDDCLKFRISKITQLQ